MNVKESPHQTPEGGGENENKSALLYVIAAVVLFSTLPIAFSIGGASKAPFLFATVMYLFSFIANITYLFFKYPKKINQKTHEIIRSKMRHPMIFWSAFGLFSYVFFAFSLRYVDEAIAAILIESSYIFMVILLARLFPKEDRYAKITMQNWFLFAVALVGVGFVIASQSSSIDNAVSELFTYSALGGIGLLLIATLLTAIVLPANQSWGSDASDNEKTEYEKKKGEKKKDGERKDDEIFYTIVANSIGKVIGVPVLVVIGLSSGENIQSIGNVGVLFAIAFGFFGLGIGNIFFRIANTRTTNLGINALGFATPAVALIWLALASRIDVPRIDWLVIGLVLIILSNILLNINQPPEQHP